jgi:hypothetical protein
MGDLKSYKPGESFKGRLWIVNDTYESYEGDLQWSVKGPSGKEIIQGSINARIGEDAAESFAEFNDTLPDEPGLYRMDIRYVGSKGELSSNWFEFEIAK